MLSVTRTAIFGLCISSTVAMRMRMIEMDVPEVFSMIDGEDVYDAEILRDYPWMVSIQDSNSKHCCGGTLIAKDWVLSAAHCVEQCDIKKVVRGVTNLKNFNSGNREDITIERKVMHHEYTPYVEHQNPWENSVLSNDIMLIKLSRPARASPISLSPPPTYPRQLATAMGWGRTDFNAIKFNIESLQKAELPLVDTRECASKMNKHKGISVDDKFICAGEVSGGKDACTGDSGGPLFVQVGNVPFLIGIVAWGHGCGLANNYGLYTNVASYSNWICRTTSNAVCPNPRPVNPTLRPTQRPLPPLPVNPTLRPTQRPLPTPTPFPSRGGTCPEGSWWGGHGKYCLGGNLVYCDYPGANANIVSNCSPGYCKSNAPGIPDQCVYDYQIPSPVLLPGFTEVDSHKGGLRACRNREGGSTENIDYYAFEQSYMSYDLCSRRCEEYSSCRGFEVSKPPNEWENGKCELWLRTPVTTRGQRTNAIKFKKCYVKSNLRQ